jgi:dihydropyrimidine dehydrogenase (NAD+) subunit PreA
MSNLSVSVAGVKFKNPIIPGSSELAEDIRGVRRMIRAGVGGVLTKSYTSMKAEVRRPKPNNFPIPGRGYSQSGSFLTYSTSHPETIDIVAKRDIPQMAEECSKAGVPLVVSYWGLIKTKNGQLDEETTDDWAQIAQDLQNAGADMIEANLSCPVVRKPFEDNPMIAYDICETVTQAVKIPVGFKISPTMGPIEKLTQMIFDAGAAFITAHNAPDGLLFDVENEVPFGAPGIGGYIIGRPMLPWSLSRILQIKMTADIPVFGSGGVYTWDDALQYMYLGCPIVQVCTSAYLKGTEIFEQILIGIEDWMQRKGYENITDIVGKGLPMMLSGAERKAHAVSPHAVPPNTPYVPIIDEGLCNYCKSCERACFKEVYQINKESQEIEIKDEYCVSCGMCVGICPRKAISLVDRETKETTIWTGEGLAIPYLDLLRKKGVV